MVFMLYPSVLDTGLWCADAAFQCTNQSICLMSFYQEVHPKMAKPLSLSSLFTWFESFPFCPTLFDSTKGYPGEGPCWSLLSANLDSLPANKHCINMPESFLAFQESRNAKSNVRDLQMFAKAHQRELVPGAALVAQPDKNGDLRVPHGSVCCVGNPLSTIPLDPLQDETGKYAALFQSTRVQAVWVQVQPKLRFLIFNVYLQSSSDPSIISKNNCYLEDIFPSLANLDKSRLLFVGTSNNRHLSMKRSTLLCWKLVGLTPYLGTMMMALHTDLSPFQVTLVLIVKALNAALR